MIDVESQIKAALKARDPAALTAWRSVKAKIGLKLTEAGRGSGKPLAEEEQLAILRKEIRERQESNEFLKPGDAKFDENRRIIAILEAHLPRPLGAAETDALIEKVLAETGAQGPRDMGKVMAALRNSGAALDMAAVSTKVKERLQAKAG
jgi:uncharacterized protein YqeY